MQTLPYYFERHIAIHILFVKLNSGVVGLILDFGIHVVGSVSFRFDYIE